MRCPLKGYRSVVDFEIGDVFFLVYHTAVRRRWGKRVKMEHIRACFDIAIPRRCAQHIRCTRSIPIEHEHFHVCIAKRKTCRRDAAGILAHTLELQDNANVGNSDRLTDVDVHRDRKFRTVNVDRKTTVLA